MTVGYFPTIASQPHRRRRPGTIIFGVLRPGPLIFGVLSPTGPLNPTPFDWLPRKEQKSSRGGRWASIIDEFYLMRSWMKMRPTGRSFVKLRPIIDINI